MRLGISKSKNTINYYIIKDYTKNDKRSTKPILRIGNLEEVKKLAGDIDYKVWLNNYVKKYNDEHSKKETIIIKKIITKSFLKMLELHLMSVIYSYKNFITN